jgi:hypothetical protein
VEKLPVCQHQRLPGWQSTVLMLGWLLESGIFG